MELFKPSDTWRGYDDRPGGGYHDKADPSDVVEWLKQRGAVPVWLGSALTGTWHQTTDWDEADGLVYRLEDE